MRASWSLWLVLPLLAGCLEAPADPAPVPDAPRLAFPFDEVPLDRAMLEERVRAREIDVASDPNDPDHMAAVMMVPYPTQYTLAPYDSMQWTGIALSEDGGLTWDYEPIRGYPGDSETGPFPGAWALGDGVLAFQPDGSLLLAVLPIRPPLAISIGVAEFPWGSREATFVSEFAAGALGVEGFHDIPTSQPGPHVDKEQIHIDPSTGHVYAAWSERWQQTAEARVVFARSTDGGRTWSDPLALAPPSPHYVGSRQHQMAGFPVTTADGRVLVPWADFANGIMYLSESDDGGVTFAPAREISRQPGFWLLSAGVDLTGGEHHGNVYVVSSDERNGDVDVFLHVSRDGGATWDDTLRVNDDPIGNGVRQRMPELVVEPDGAVSIVYMGGVEGGEDVHAFVARSVDGGHSFEVRQVSTAPTSPAGINNQPSFLTHLGDYIGIAYNRDGVVAAWQDGRESTPETPYSEAWVVRLPTRT